MTASMLGRFSEGLSVLSPNLTATHRALAVGLFAVGALAVSGCAVQEGSASGQSPVRITYAYWALSAEETRITRSLIAEFEASHPGVEVSLLEITDRYYDKLTTLFATKQGPEVFSANYGRLGDFVREGQVADLTPLLAKSEALSKSGFLPAAYEAFAGIGSRLGRPGLYGLPRDWGPTNLVAYDRDAFDAAGVAYPTRGWTWEDFAGVCRRLTVRKGDGKPLRYGAGVCLYPYMAVGWFRQSGGEVLSEDGTRSTLGCEANVTALRFLRDLARDRVLAPVNPAHDESAEQLCARRVAMALVTPYTLADLKKQTGLRWGLATPPTGRRRAAGCIPTGVAVSARTRNQEAAFALAWMLATEGARRTSAEALCVPAWMPALKGPQMACPSSFGPEAAAVLQEAAALACPHPISPSLTYETMMSSLRSALEQVFQRDADPAEALLAAQKRLNSSSGGPP